MANGTEAEGGRNLGKIQNQIRLRMEIKRMVC